MTSQILHLSDLHVGKTNKEGDNLKKIINKTVEKWEDEENKPVILITGDIVDDGMESQFIEARRILDPLYLKGFRLLLIPGNHDYGYNGVHAVESRFKYFKNVFYPLENVSYPFPKEIDGHIFIGLNSMKAETHFFDGLLADGELGSKQINNTIGILKKLETRRPEYKVIIYLHHHPFLFPDENVFEEIVDKIGHWLKDGDDFMHKISGRPDIILFGHEHRHLDFSGTQISRKYRIPVILSGGKSTDDTMIEYKVADNGETESKIINKGLMGHLIKIQDNGNIEIKNMTF